MKLLQSYQAASSSRSLASTLALARMDAARNFTQTQVNCNLAANSCQVQICTNKGAITCNAFTPEGGPVLLSQGTTFGFGGITVPAGTQTTIQNTAQILFNSRGIPVDNTGTPTANNGLYLTGQGGRTYAVTVYATGKIAVWRYNNGAWRNL
jgi:Tfp pilus assembly protein FimT